MRLILFSICIFLIAFTTALFFLGYDGHQIREYLLGVGAIILLAWRISKPPSQADKPTDKPTDKTESTERRRERRLSDSQRDSDDESEADKPSESTRQS